MKKIVVGFYLKPHVWIGKREKHKSPTEFAFVEHKFSSNIDLGIQKQGLVCASIDSSEVSGYQESHACNVLRSEVTSFVLNFFNAFSFAIYEAQLKKHEGAFGSIPQEVSLDDLYSWPGEYESIEEANADQPIPIQSDEFKTFQEMVANGKKQ
jgi:hypothetical protein